jgi:3'(2'), 5'-bisphosphate nucleotidase
MLNLNNPKLDFALTAVQQAALLTEEIQEEMISPAITKQDRSPVTVADFAAQAVVGYYLERRFPEAVLVGEEHSDVLRQPAGRETLEKVTKFVRRVIPGLSPEQVCDYIDRGKGEVEDSYWTLDPVDGTKGFLRGDQYAVALALVEGGRVRVGVLGCPNLSPEQLGELEGNGSLLAAVRGEGSWMTVLEASPADQVFKEILVSKQADPARARILRSFESGHTNVSQIDEFQDALGTTSKPVRMDSQAKYALLAAGAGEVYLRLLSEDRRDYKEKVWDQAAGSVLVEEAGGMVTDLDGVALDFSWGRELSGNRGLCATNGLLHKDALQALDDVQA